MSNPNPEIAYGIKYQDSVEVECRALYGMEPDEFYRRQTGLVLDQIPDSISDTQRTLLGRNLPSHYKLPNGHTLQNWAKKCGLKILDKCNLKLGPGKKVLDLAVGEGDTSRYLATTGADVEARELSPYLVTQAIERDSRGVNDLLEDVRGKVNYQVGDYSKSKESLEEGSQFDAVMVLSNSFLYLKDRAEYVKTLKDFNDLLLPDGKLVLQCRSTINNEYPWAKEKGTKCFTNEEGDLVMEDGTGRKFIRREGSKTSETLPDGMIRTQSSRYLIEADGTQKELGTIDSTHMLNWRYLDIWKPILEEAGFSNIRLKAEGFSEGNGTFIYALIADKSGSNKANRTRSRLRGLLDKFL